MPGSAWSRWSWSLLVMLFGQPAGRRKPSLACSSHKPDAGFALPATGRRASPVQGFALLDHQIVRVGRITLKHALIGALVAALLWQLSRHYLLLWYFETLSQISTVYGSLTTAIAVLLSLEVAATLLLLGAQTISEYERLDRADAKQPPQPFTTRPN